MELRNGFGEKSGFNISQTGWFSNTTTFILEDENRKNPRNTSYKNFKVMGEEFEYITEPWQEHFYDTPCIVVLVVSMPQNYHKRNAIREQIGRHNDNSNSGKHLALPNVTYFSIKYSCVHPKPLIPPFML